MLVQPFFGCVCSPAGPVRPSTHKSWANCRISGHGGQPSFSHSIRCGSDHIVWLNMVDCEVRYVSVGFSATFGCRQRRVTMSGNVHRLPNRETALKALYDDLSAKHMFPFWATSADV